MVLRDRVSVKAEFELCIKVRRCLGTLTGMCAACAPQRVQSSDEEADLAGMGIGLVCCARVSPVKEPRVRIILKSSSRLHWDMPGMCMPAGCPGAATRNMHARNMHACRLQSGTTATKCLSLGTPNPSLI